MVVQHNMQAVNTNRMLGQNVKAVKKATEKLSSGYAVNRAADDAAGLSISEKMRNQIRGINQAVKNSEDGVSLIQTAEGNMNEIHSILQRMGELATKAANDVNASDDRDAIQDEIDQLAEEILPQLRRSRLTAPINVIGKSDEELMAAFNADPTSLSVDELLYTATLTDDNAKRAEIYKACIKRDANDYRGYNNLGMVQFAEGDYSAAKANFEKAQKLAPTSNEAKMNLGLCELMDNNLRNANNNFGAAAGAEGLNEALGVYYLKLGDYNNAVKAFGDSKSNNAALAQIMTKDYSKAKNTLGAIANPDATTYYLLAVLGARTNNEQMVLSNLAQAVKLDGSLAQKAATDMEFAKFNISSVVM